MGAVERELPLEGVEEREELCEEEGVEKGGDGEGEGGKCEGSTGEGRVSSFASVGSRLVMGWFDFLASPAPPISDASEDVVAAPPSTDFSFVPLSLLLLLWLLLLAPFFLPALSSFDFFLLALSPLTF